MFKELRGVKSVINKIFVYGTLRRGDSNHYLIEPYLTEVQAAKMRGVRCRMISIPAMIKGDSWVNGEVITFNEEEKVLKILDELEEFIEPGNINNLYERSVDWAFYEDGSQEQVYCYRWARDKERLIKISRNQ
jgi:gamma-glutamylcyclotransferase (GGCT)/AIG2-like uncharacterized protein YtfP